MSHTYPLKNGEVTFEENRILIKDNTLYPKRIFQITAVVWTIYGAFSIYRYQKEGDAFYLWSGLLIGGLHLIVLILSMFVDTRKEIPRAEIRGMRTTKRFGNHLLIIKLPGMKSRRLTLKEETALEIKALIPQYSKMNHR